MNDVTPMEKYQANGSLKLLSVFCLLAGLFSIPLAIFLWSWGPEMGTDNLLAIEDPAHRAGMMSAHKERWGLFVGLWAPTFLILSHILHHRCHSNVRYVQNLPI